ncbi:MAG: c-type cytochrome [Gammaproteobacteria bacterium]|nr:c-type cytochrome [Gammaproteobacteria bacterium]
MKTLLFLILLSIFQFGYAADSEIPIRLEHVRVNVHNRASVLRGAKFFAKNCMVCHSMRYLEHNKLANSAGITLAKMPLKNQQWWLGIAPPDLSLIARVYSADWLYSYFHAFYKDASRPTGFNNLVARDKNMMNVFLTYQGEQVLIPPAEQKHLGAELGKPRYFSVLKLVKQGSMTPAEFNASMTDLVNFLVYASDPGAVHRHRLGFWVLLFLAILFVLAYFLKKEYWKDID